MISITRSAFFLALIASATWAFIRPDYDSIAATAGALAAFISSFFLGEKSSSARQNQEISGSGIGIQASGDVNIGKIANREK